jgi:hypothetical protein
MSFHARVLKPLPLQWRGLPEGLKIDFASFQIPFDIYFNPSN